MLRKVENKVEKVVSGASAAVTGAKDAVTGALDSRAHTVTVRLDNDSLKCVDEMVRAEVVPDRSTAVLDKIQEGFAYLVKQGISVSADLLDKIQEGFDRIEGIKQELRGLRNGVSVDVEATPGDDPVRLYAELCHVIEDVIDDFKARGRPLPDPSVKPVQHAT